MPATLVLTHYGYPSESAFWGAHANKHLLLALISPCKTNGRDGAKELTSFKPLQASESQVIVDLQTITSKIGRVETRGRWGIIDRSTEAARTVFYDVDDDLHVI